MTDGCIYIARNDESDPPNHYKIGKTSYASPENRMAQLNSDTTRYRGEYVAKGYVLVEDVDTCERKIHRVLSQYRINPNREYFKAPYKQIFKVIDEVVDSLGGNS